MTVLVDTSVWSLALRRRQHQLSGLETQLVDEWKRLVVDEQVVIIGPIRQELLSGVKRRTDFVELRRRLSVFVDLPLESRDYEEAAHFFNQLRAKGITGTPTDLLICSAAHRFRVAVFTTDTDFEDYAKHLPITLHSPQ